MLLAVSPLAVNWISHGQLTVSGSLLLYKDWLAVKVDIDNADSKGDGGKREGNTGS